MSTVPLHEVRAHPQKWVPAFQYEYDVLVKDTGAVEPIPKGLKMIPIEPIHRLGIDHIGRQFPGWFRLLGMKRTPG